jgi:hypothetical protein
MKLLGFAWLVAGWLIALAALLLLPPAGMRTGFFVTGFLLELLGLGLVVYAHIEHHRERES